RVGQVLARAGEQAGLDLTLGGRGGAPACSDAEVVLLCIPDAAIAETAATAPASFPRLRFIGHTRGATGLDALPAARGPHGFGLHPLQTVPDAEADLGGAPCAVSGSSPEALELARSLATHLGMRPFEIGETDRAAYHAAAAIASNFLVALEESAA